MTCFIYINEHASHLTSYWLPKLSVTYQSNNSHSYFYVFLEFKVTWATETA